MTAERVVAWAFLAVACVAFTVQSVAFRRMLHGSTAPVRALRRTQASRIACAALYVAVGVNALCAQWEALAATLTVFTVTQTIWMVNAGMDVRLRRQLPTDGD